MKNVRRKNLIILMAIFATVLVVTLTLMIGFINPDLRYAKAGSLMLKGDYYNTMLLYRELGNYADSNTRSRVAELYAQNYNLDVQDFIGQALTLGVRVQVAYLEQIECEEENQQQYQEQESSLAKVWYLINRHYQSFEDISSYEQQGLIIPVQEGKTFAGWAVYINVYVMHECQNYITKGTLQGDYVYIELMASWQ